MWYATDVRTGTLISATPDANAICPGCLEPVIPKCGEIISWHFAHRSNDCDSWSEPESEWHLKWKELAPPERREVVIENHRADVIWPGHNGILELQHSSISLTELREREEFYRSKGYMVKWLF